MASFCVWMNHTLLVLQLFLMFPARMGGFSFVLLDPENKKRALYIFEEYTMVTKQCLELFFFFASCANSGGSPFFATSAAPLTLSFQAAANAAPKAPTTWGPSSRSFSRSLSRTNACRSCPRSCAKAVPSGRFGPQTLQV